MNRLLLAAALLAAAPLAAADFALDSPGLDGMKASVAGFKERLAPAAVDKTVVDKLFTRLAHDGPTYTRSNDTAGGGTETLQVTLVEAEPPDAESEGLMVRDLVYRRYFRNITGVRQTIRPMASGEAELDQYEYTVSLDGRILAVKHVVLVVVAVTPQGLVTDPARAKVFRLPPSDPSVLKRWQGMSAEFLKMGRTLSV